jgi:hypothetical protein
MQAPLTAKVMNEAANSSHARRAEGRGASAFIVSDTYAYVSFIPACSMMLRRACVPAGFRIIVPLAVRSAAAATALS